MSMAFLATVLVILITGVSHAAEHCPAAVQQARTLLRQEERLIPHAARPLAGASTTPDLVKAAELVEAAERACRTGDMDGAVTKANAAITELRRKP
jgi:hypothetical protein